MAGMKLVLRTTEYRPCYVDGKKALFHRWEQKERAAIKVTGKHTTHSLKKLNEIMHEYEARGVLPSPEYGIEMHPVTVAIVEYEDGTVAEVAPSDVRFVPGLMNEYDFAEEVNETRDGID